MLAPTKAELAAERSRRSLRYFAQAAWPLVEPGVPFSGNWHIDVICEHLEAVSRREIRRLIINIPPRCMKSLTVCVFWPCWEWLDRPETKWLFASYAEKLSLRDSLKCRRLIRSAGVRDGKDRGIVEQIGYQGLLRVLEGQDAWSLALDQDAKGKFENTRKGYRLATSIGGTATGEGGDIVVIDDPHKANETESDKVRTSVIEWHDSTIPTRFNQPKTGAEVLIMQRLHEEDLAGHLLVQDGWTHLCLPMEHEPKHQFVWPDDPRKVEGELLWSDRIGPDELKAMKAGLGGYRAAGQLQQRPAPAEGLLFKRKHFRRWRTAESLVGAITAVTYLLDGDDGDVEHVDAGFCRIFQTVDVAASDKETSDYTVVSTWAITPKRQLLLLEVDRQHFDVLDVAGFLKRKNDAHGSPPMWIETFGAGNGPFKTLQNDHYPVLPLRPEHGTQTDKISRAWPAVAAYERHDFFHPEDAEWLGEFEGELLSFPNGKNDDQVDTVSYAARLLSVVGIAGGARPPDAKPKTKPLTAGLRSKQF
jgi:phage terminase large subunit-like protein